MKKNALISILITLSSYTVVIGQNGVYQSTKYEFINQNEPSRNRVDYIKNVLIIQINEIQGEFIGGKILWELKSEESSEYLEMSLKSLKNSYFDDENKAFIKVYYADLKALDQVLWQIEVFIWRFVNDNTYRVDWYDPNKKTLARFDKLVKL